MSGLRAAGAKETVLKIRKPVTASLDHAGAAALVARVRAMQQECQTGCGRLMPAGGDVAKAERLAMAARGDRPAPHAPKVQTRFDTIVAAANLSPSKLAQAFAKSREPLASDAAPLDAPSDDRFAHIALTAGLSTDEEGPTADRFGPATAIENGYLLASLIPSDEAGDLADVLSSDAVDASPVETAALDPVEVPIPSRRPALDKLAPRESDEKPIAAVPEKPIAAAPRKPIFAAPDKPAAASPKARSDRAAPLLAYASPDEGKPTVGGAFRNLFNSGPSVAAGKGVAVYNISAGTVTMPDGQVLEAHSGIGHMADNPKYINVKMNGPTPPDTYKLKMRERRFHGVEAIRMLPVDGKVKHGRDGFLTHSELLRGRKNQSHGCVAFKDYNRFLNAFKKGKVTHIVVIPGNGKGKGSSTRVASNSGSRT